MASLLLVHEIWSHNSQVLMPNLLFFCHSWFSTFGSTTSSCKRQTKKMLWSFTDQNQQMFGCRLGRPSLLCLTKGSTHICGMRMWVAALSGIALWQCLSNGRRRTTSKGRSELLCCFCVINSHVNSSLSLSINWSQVLNTFDTCIIVDLELTKNLQHSISCVLICVENWSTTRKRQSEQMRQSLKKKLTWRKNRMRPNCANSRHQWKTRERMRLIKG